MSAYRGRRADRKLRVRRGGSLKLILHELCAALNFSFIMNELIN